MLRAFTIGPSLLMLTMVAGTACHRSTSEVSTPLPQVTSNGTQPHVKRVKEMLAGRFAGVHVLPMRNGGFSVRIRGMSSFLANTEPLYVIDGMAVEVQPGEGLDWLDPADILEIDVLKDPVDTSIYGARGANGVIVIRTRGAPR
jgi:TonB-dependent starch-binding outer membrane protein SusC